jgi:PKD repeat protein
LTAGVVLVLFGVLSPQSNVLYAQQSSAAAFIFIGVGATLPSPITLVPDQDACFVDEAFTITATVVDDMGDPLVGVAVDFEILNGPNMGDSTTADTDSAGMATFTYTGDGGLGTDEIQASYFDGQNTIFSSIADKTWVPIPVPPTVSFTMDAPACEPCLEGGAVTTQTCRDNNDKATECDPPLTVIFDASASVAPANSVYTWDFGDGNTSGPLPQAELTRVEHRYLRSGVFDVTLTIRDGIITEVATKTLTIDEVKPEDLPNPEISFIPTPASGPPPLKVTFLATAKNVAILRWDWDFGDEEQAIVGAQSTVTHTYTQFGSFLPKVRAIREDNGQVIEWPIADADAVRINVTTDLRGGPPIALASADPTVGGVPLQVKFSARDSFDPDNDVLDFLWDYNDGSPPGTGITPTHVFTLAGNYTITLFATDPTGQADTDTVTIQVLAPGGTPVDPPPGQSVPDDGTDGGDGTDNGDGTGDDGTGDDGTGDGTDGGTDSTDDMPASVLCGTAMPMTLSLTLLGMVGLRIGAGSRRRRR